MQVGNFYHHLYLDSLFLCSLEAVCSLELSAIFIHLLYKLRTVFAVNLICGYSRACKTVVLCGLCVKLEEVQSLCWWLRFKRTSDLYWGDQGACSQPAYNQGKVSYRLCLPCSYNRQIILRGCRHYF